ncbi:MAG: VanZ family protein [Saprospiraceae bacterium]|nr:VanZ family protein [Saprospiraceae bacterium]
MTRRFVAAIWTIILITATLLPKGVVSKNGLFNIPHFDKISHFFSYLLLVYLWSTALNEKTNKIKAARIAFYGAILLGIVLEILQWQLNVGRHFEILDIIANIIGSIIGLIAFYKLFKH